MHNASISAAEFYAIYLWVTKKDRMANFSYYQIHSCQDHFTHQLIAQRILISLHSSFIIFTGTIFIWISRPIDFGEHELINSAAREATNLSKVTFLVDLILSDLKAF